MAEGEQRLIGEVRGRSRRLGLDAEAAGTAEADALDKARADAADHLVAHDPQRARNWIDWHRGLFRDPATQDRLDGWLRPYAAERDADPLASSGRPDAADAAAPDAETQAAIDRSWTKILDPSAVSLRVIPPADHVRLPAEHQAAISAAIAANRRGRDPAPDPALFQSLADKAQQGTLGIADVRQAWGKLPLRHWQQVDAWQRGEDPMAGNIVENLTKHPIIGGDTIGSEENLRAPRAIGKQPVRLMSSGASDGQAHEAYLLAGMAHNPNGVGRISSNILHYANDKNLSHDLDNLIKTYGIEYITDQITKELNGNYKSIVGLSKILSDNGSKYDGTSSSTLGSALLKSLSREIIVTGRSRKSIIASGGTLGRINIRNNPDAVSAAPFGEFPRLQDVTKYDDLIKRPLRNMEWIPIWLDQLYILKRHTDGMMRRSGRSI